MNEKPFPTQQSSSLCHFTSSPHSYTLNSAHNLCCLLRSGFHYYSNNHPSSFPLAGGDNIAVSGESIATSCSAGRSALKQRSRLAICTRFGSGRGKNFFRWCFFCGIESRYTEDSRTYKQIIRTKLRKITVISASNEKWKAEEAAKSRKEISIQVSFLK